MERALIIVDHGSRVPEAHAHLQGIAERVQERAPEFRVYVAHMELATPTLPESIAACVRDGAGETIACYFETIPKAPTHRCREVQYRRPSTNAGLPVVFERIERERVQP